MANYIDPRVLAEHVEQVVIEEVRGMLLNQIDEVNPEYTHDGNEDEIVDEAYCILIKNLYKRC